MEISELMPPVDLIREVGIGMIERDDVTAAQKQFHNIGYGLIREMVHDGYIKHDSCVLDVGCGLGRLARPLTEILTSGDYRGIDVVKSSIDWLVKAYAKYPNFKFIHADVFNTHYNKTAITKASEYVFPLQNASFDFQFSTSLFTHTLIDVVDNYIGQIGRVLKPGGITWNTFFLLDEISEPLAREHRGNTRMRNSVDGGLVSNPKNPEHQIGLYTWRVKSLFKKHGFEVLETRNGRWSERTDNIRASYQDVIIAQKPIPS